MTGGVGSLFQRTRDTLNHNPGRLTRLGSLFEHDPTRKASMLENAQYVENRSALTQAADALVSQGKARNREEAMGMVQYPNLFKQTGGAGSGTSFGKTPIWGTDSVTGKTGFGVIIENPDGSPGFKLMDTGSFQPRRRTIPDRHRKNARHGSAVRRGRQDRQAGGHAHEDDAEQGRLH
jgi:hypothetical protein